MTIDTVLDKKLTASKKIQKPKKYKVVVYNDNVTPMEFVIAMFVSVFHHNEEQAYVLTMNVHTKGSEIAGVYNFEIAEQKAMDASTLARTHGWPLTIKIEQE